MDQDALSLYQSSLASTVQTSTSVPEVISNTQKQHVPSLPPRDVAQTTTYQNLYGYGGFGYGAMNYGYGGPGGLGYGMGYTSYPGYSGYRFGVAGFGLGCNSLFPGAQNSFINQAEESTRPAFQSVQSLVNTFGSMTMMLESTFHAFHSSFLAVLGVADNLGRLRSVFGQVFSAFALFRFMNVILKKLLYLLGLRKNNPTVKSVWEDSHIEINSTLDGNNSADAAASKPPATNWLLLGFLSVVMTAPYFVYKLLLKVLPPLNKECWNPLEDRGTLAVALYNFNGESSSDLPLVARQTIMIAPKKFQSPNNPDWLLACNENKTIGLIPANYISLITK